MEILMLYPMNNAFFNFFIVIFNFIFGIENRKSSPKRESSGEKTARELLEERLGEKFPTIRPDWLLSPNGRKLELDGWCEKLNLAFEYNGIQHLQSGHFGMTDKKFSDQQGRDRTKYIQLMARGVRCIIFENTPIDQIEHEIIKQLKVIDPSLCRKFTNNTSLYYKILIILHKKIGKMIADGL